MRTNDRLAAVAARARKALRTARRLPARLAAARSFLGLVVDPARIGDVFALADAVMDDATLDAMVINVARHDQGARALAERPRLGDVSLPRLCAYPAGTLGRVYGDHLVAAGLDPQTLPVRPAGDARSYVLPHIYETHDVWHVVTGFDTSVAGELGLMAFYAAQGPSKGPLAILTAGFVNTLVFSPREKDVRMDAIVRGWRLGRAARPLFGVRWADLWATPIAEVRRRFAIELDPAATTIPAGATAQAA